MEMNNLTRREFLKLASVFSLSPLLNALPNLNLAHTGQKQTLPNVIIILFDSLTARNLSLYGYPRKTSPNLEKFAGKATVYHNHHSASSFTTPSTASLLTSTYPWTHRVLSVYGLFKPSIAYNNLFRSLGDAYHREVYAQNIIVDALLYQLEDWLDDHVRLDAFSLTGNLIYNKLFPKDAISGKQTFDNFLFRREEPHGSLMLSLFYDLSTLLRIRLVEKKLVNLYPTEVPRLANTDVYFSFDQVTDGIMGLLDDLPPSSFTYFHLMPPHEPYVPSRSYLDMFDDGWAPTPKKKHPLSNRLPENRLNERRLAYDQFIVNLDNEFGRIMDHLKNTGKLDNSYVIFTADHGELFERGTHGHSGPLLFEPVIHIPLIISAPGQAERQDIYELTSNVDIMPTFLKLANLPIPEWCFGKPLPGLGGNDTSERSIFIVEAKENPSYQPLSKASVAVIQGQYKLVHYIGYEKYADNYELYDLENDPDELDNLYDSHPMASQLKETLAQGLQQADQLYK
jgi:arylsulfatase A-like enzyme